MLCTFLTLFDVHLYGKQNFVGKTTAELWAAFHLGLAKNIKNINQTPFKYFTTHTTTFKTNLFSNKGQV